MSHTVTAKLNKAARKHDLDDGAIFFVSLGEKNFDRQQKANVWTNYDAALFANGKQVDFYADALTEGAVIAVSGSGIIIDDSNKDYAPKLKLIDSKLEFVSAGQQSGGAPAQQQAARQQQPAQQQAPAANNFDDTPF